MSEDQHLALDLDQLAIDEEQQSLYRPLNTDVEELRILIIKAGKAHQPVDLELLYWSREHAISQGYETVSYCWGDSYTEIEVAGSKIRVSLSAEEALKSFRRADQDRAVWIDSICLNQKDDVEKSYQVARMHHIYRNAFRTLIWLGPDDGTVGAAFNIIHELWAAIGKATDDTFSFENVLDRAWFDETSSTGTVDFDPFPLLKLFSRAWFSRLWIMQEIALSKMSTIFCGAHEISPIRIHRVAWWLLYKRSFLTSDLRDQERSIRTAAYMTAHADPEFSWFSREMADATPPAIWRELLVDQQRSNVREPKDRVYGMLGMYQHFSGEDTLPPLLQPDYSRPLRDVYRDATRYAMASGTIDVLERVRRHCPEEHEGTPWPSWVPCWHHQTNEEMDEFGLARFHEADGGWTQPSEDHTDPDVLTLYGFRVDPDSSNGIQKLSGLVDTGSDSDFDQLLAEVSNLSGVDLNTAPAAAIRDLVITLVGGENASHRPATDEDVEDFLSFRRHTHSHNRYPPDFRSLTADTSIQEQQAARFCHGMWNATGRRRFFITESGLYGLGPQNMQAGNVAVVLWGGKWPFILRPVREESEVFEFVGTCYVNGIMGGEAAEKFVEEDLEAGAFEIR